MINNFKGSWNFDKTLDFSELINNCHILFKKNIKPERIKEIKMILEQIRLWRNAEAHDYSKNHNIKSDEYLKVIKVIIKIASKT